MDTAALKTIRCHEILNLVIKVTNVCKFVLSKNIYIFFLFVKFVMREISLRAFVMREIAKNQRVKRDSDPSFAMHPLKLVSNKMKFLIPV